MAWLIPDACSRRIDRSTGSGTFPGASGSPPTHAEIRIRPMRAVRRNRRPLALRRRASRPTVDAFARPQIDEHASKLSVPSRVAYATRAPDAQRRSPCSTCRRRTPKIRVRVRRAGLVELDQRFAQGDDINHCAESRSACRCRSPTRTPGPAREPDRLPLPQVTMPSRRLPWLTSPPISLRR